MNQPVSLYIKFLTFYFQEKTKLKGMDFTVNAKNLLVILTLILTNTHATSIDAQNWLVNHQGANGDFNNAFFSGDASAALTALPTANKALTANYLNIELNNFASFSTWGDAQSAAYAIAAMHGNSFPIDNESAVINKLLTFRDNTTGGFIGWYEAPAFNQVTSAPDTALALIALKTTNTLNPAELTQSLNYLLSLQNPDGSYNLTANTESSGLAAFTPTKQSTTALVLMALAVNGLNESNTPQVTQSLNYLENQIQCQSPIAQNSNALALTAAALNIFSKTQSAQFAAYYLQQNEQPDGGFFEPARGSNNENPIDTALASIELNETATLNPCQSNTSLIQIQNTTNLYARDYANFEITLQNNASDENITVKLYNNGALQQTQTTQIQANTNTTLTLQSFITYGQNQITVQLQNDATAMNQNYDVDVIRLNAPIGITTFELPEIKTNLTIDATADTQLTLAPSIETIFGTLNANEPKYSTNLLTINTNTTPTQTTITLTPTPQENTTYDLTSGSIYEQLIGTPYVLHAITILPNTTNYQGLTNRCNFFAVAMRLSGINYTHINPQDSPFQNPVPEYCLSELAAAADLNILRRGEGLNNTLPRGNWTVSTNGIVRNAAAVWLYRINRAAQNGWGAQLLANWTLHKDEINFSQTEDPLAYRLKLQAFYAYTTGGITNVTTLPNGDLDICFECTPTLQDAMQLIYHMLGVQNQAITYQPNWIALPTTFNGQTYAANVTLPAKFKLGWTATAGQNNNNNNNNPQGVHVIIDMPQGADVDTYVQNCATAQQCFTQAGATLIGTTYNIPCPSGSPTTQLFVHTVNGYYANFSINEAYWEFFYNQQSSSAGLSCQQTNNGDTIKLQVTDNQTNTPVQTSSSSGSSGGSSTGSSSVVTQSNNSNQTNKPLTTDSITRLNTEGFNAPQTAASTQQTQNAQPSTTTGLFPALSDNPIAIIGIIALIIAGIAAYQYRKKPNAPQ